MAEIIILFIVGIILGSFINALVWRLHEQESLGTKGKKGAKSKPALLRKQDLSILHGRSMCPNCHHALAPKDLIPVISWVALRGKCRYCHQTISFQYPLVELCTALLFVLSYTFWPYKLDRAGWLLFGVWMVVLVYLVALAVYDFKWYLLPNKLVYQLYMFAAIYGALLIILDIGSTTVVSSILGLLVGGGVYYLIFQISGGKWIGGGDVKLGGALGLLAGGPWLAFMMLFVSSLLGTLVALPLMAAGKAKRTSKLPYGPFLIVAAIIVVLFGANLADWYEGLLL